MSTSLNFRVFSLLVLFGLPIPVFAFINDHSYPDITGFDNPYIGVQYRKSVGGLYKGLVNYKRLSVGLKRERYDNNYSRIEFAYSEGKSQDDILTSQGINLMYGAGSHISRHVDWNFFLTGGFTESKTSIDTDKATDGGLDASVGAQILYGPFSFLDIGLELEYGIVFQGASALININF